MGRVPADGDVLRQAPRAWEHAAQETPSQPVVKVSTASDGQKGGARTPKGVVKEPDLRAEMLEWRCAQVRRVREV
jgi:hypothetical protein